MVSRGTIMMAVSARYRIQPALKPLSLSIDIGWSVLVIGIGMRRERAATLRIHGYLLEFVSMTTMLHLLAEVVKRNSSPDVLDFCGGRHHNESLILFLPEPDSVFL